MEKVELLKQFSGRLKDAMLAAGFYSGRSTSGVCIHKLVEITGYSTQICRKYLRGEAIPEPAKLVEIAQCLKVSPGWLLFGDEPDARSFGQDALKINKNVLQHIFRRLRTLYHSDTDEQEIAEFLMGMINDISQINASEEQSLKIVDLAFSSARSFTYHVQ